MSNFELDNSSIDKEKCFILNRSEIEQRLDPFYYVPSLLEFEGKVQSHNPKPLRDFIISVSSGATPKTSESEKYYSDEENGIPFLRVQNLSPTGFLNLANCKYINEETHNNYLKRSQVNEHDLLVKITGVGRMAVASIAPDNFVGNTNQHMVIIKTKDKETSEILASYLNTDIGEKLASRRATGGTRPALDYSALLSIPIIYDTKILDIYNNAIKIKNRKERASKKLLSCIDKYILDELNITIPQIDNSLEKRMFVTSLNKISGTRFDSNYYLTDYNEVINSSSYEIKKLKDYCTFIAGYAFSSSDYLDSSNTILITIKNIFKNSIQLTKTTYLPDSYLKEYAKYKIKNNDLLIAMTGATIGKVGLFNTDKNALLNQRNGIIRSNTINTVYLMNLLNISLYQEIILLNAVGGAQPNISETGIMNLNIPLPLIDKQNEIASHIQKIRDKSAQLQGEANKQMILAKEIVEQMILGE